jgi:hypothetical protein
LAGTALLVHEARPCKLEYEIDCDDSWQTQSALVWGSVGGTPFNLRVERIAERWTLNDEIVSALDGCIDIDLGFSPSTNLLPIRRLELDVGQDARVRAAWVRFPQLVVEVLEQTYTRTSERVYHYESASGAFKRDLTVDATGFVVDYPGIWRAVY